MSSNLKPLQKKRCLCHKNTFQPIYQNLWEKLLTPKRACGSSFLCSSGFARCVSHLLWLLTLQFEKYSIVESQNTTSSCQQKGFTKYVYWGLIHRIPFTKKKQDIMERIINNTMFLFAGVLNPLLHKTQRLHVFRLITSHNFQTNDK